MHAAWGAAEMWPTMAPLLLVHSQRTVLTSCNLDAHTRTRADAHTRRRAHAHTRTRAHAHTHAHAHAQAYAHTRTHTCTRKRADVAPARGPHARVVVTVAQLEIAILSVWPWEEFCVRVFNIENEPPKGQPSLLPRMVAMLAPQGYAHMLRIGVDEVFVCTTPCPPATEAAAAASSSGDLSAARVDTTAGGAMPLTQLGLRGSRHEHEHAHEPPSTRRRNRVLNLRAKQHEERRLGRWTQSRRAGQTE